MLNFRDALPAVDVDGATARGVGLVEFVIREDGLDEEEVEGRMRESIVVIVRQVREARAFLVYLFREVRCFCR
jgi:hypothetical protein